MSDGLKNQAGTPGTDFSAAEIARLTVALEQERVKSQRYRLAAESSTNLIYEWDLSSHIEWLGQVDELLGYQLNEIPRTWEAYTSRLHSEDRDLFLKAIEKRLKSEEPYSVESRVQRKDGTYLYWKDQGSVVRDESGKPVKWIGAITDVTERKKAEKDLRDSEEKYRVLVENAAEAIVVEQDGRLKFVNRLASQISGYSKQELLAMPFVELIHPDDRAMVGEHHRKRLQGDLSTSKYAFRWTSKDGSIKWVEINAVLVTWEGKPATLNFLADITERKQAEEDLKESENKYRLLADNVQDVIFVLDMNLKFTYVSPSVKSLRGYEPEEVLRQTPRESLTPLSWDLAGRNLAEIMEIEKSGHADIPVSRTLQLEMIRKDGSTVWTEVIFSFIKDEHQRVVSILGVTRNITEHRLENERTKKALEATIQAISMTVEMRDPYTAGHQRRVADLAGAIAVEMNFSLERITAIRIAAAIHDLGKISVPAEMLSKPTKLTDLEFTIIKTHAQSGYDILKDIEFPWPVARIVLEHHERVNGSGYPNGLTGDHVLMESRILSVADVVEAMASHRPYRASLGIEAALKEISKNKGILYETEVVNACLRLFHEKNYRIID